MCPRSPLLFLFALGLIGCGDDDPGARAADAGTAPEAVPDLGRVRDPRNSDPRVVRLRAALDGGDVDLARALMDSTADLAGPVEGPLLRARLAGFDPRGELDVLRLVEQARRAGPDDPRVAATSTELHAWSGRLGQAEEELRQAGLALGSADTPPELLRAYGITVLCTPGARPREGLAYLERALAADSELPFTAHALAQAHLLVAKELAGSGDTEDALSSIERSLEIDPSDLEVRRMQAELLVGLGQWGTAIGHYETLMGEGLELQGEAADLYKRAAFWAEVNHGDRPLALKYLRRALELGLPRRVLGETEARVLRECADEEALRGAELFAAEDLDGADAAFEAALFLDPRSLLARNFRGDLHHTRGRFEQAAADWQAVITDARLEGIDLPEPVHLKLAHLQAIGLDDLAGAFETLDAYLVLEPAGEWVETTRAVLEQLGPPPEDETEGDGG
jgi:tetratricopeptide (TPR) repeat protein